MSFPAHAYANDMNSLTVKTTWAGRGYNPSTLRFGFERVASAAR
jgi:hypothetical protein